MSNKYNVKVKSRQYKDTANKVLQKLDSLGFEVQDLNNYLERKSLLNKVQAEKYFEKLLIEKNR